MNSFTIDVHVSSSIFRRFALFDVFIKRRRWISPAIFACIMTTFAGIALIARTHTNQAILLSFVLLAVGLILPLVYFCSYLVSVNTQIKRMKLSAQPRYAYTLSLDPGNLVAVISSKSKVYPWSDIDGVYKRSDCIYIYASPAQAYLLPRDQLDSDAVWNMLQAVLPAHVLIT